MRAVSLLFVDRLGQCLPRWGAAVLIGWAAGSAMAQSPTTFHPQPAQVEHLQMLRTGGMVVFMVAGVTDAQQPDRVPLEVGNCASQRVLTNAGRAQLQAIAHYWATLNVPYRSVISSPLCRAMDTARLVFGEPVEVDIDLRRPAGVSVAERQAAAQYTQALLEQPVRLPRTNRIVVSHRVNLMALLGDYPPEGSMVLLQPKGVGKGVKYLATIAPQDWPILLKQLEAGQQ